MGEKLPNYRGGLRPAEWAELELTPEKQNALRFAALRGCAGCRGKGWVSGSSPGRVSPCVCVNRRTETEGSPR